MKIAPKPTLGLEMSLDELLTEPKTPRIPEEETQVVEPPIVDPVPAMAPKQAQQKRPEFSIKFLDRMGDLIEFRNVRVWDGNGGMRYPTIEMYTAPILVKNYSKFLFLDAQAKEDPPRTLDHKLFQFVCSTIGWTLPTRFQVASAPTIYGVMQSLANEGCDAMQQLGYARIITRMFPRHVIKQGIYTGTWIVSQNKGLDYAHHQDGILDGSGPVIDLTRNILPPEASSSPITIHAGELPSDNTRFGEYCKGIIGTEYWEAFTKIIQRLGGIVRPNGYPPHFKLLTQFYKKPVPAFGPLEQTPVIIATNPNDLDLTKPQIKPDRAYVYAVRVVRQ